MNQAICFWLIALLTCIFHINKCSTDISDTCSEGQSLVNAAFVVKRPGQCRSTMYRKRDLIVFDIDHTILESKTVSLDWSSLPLEALNEKIRVPPCGETDLDFVFLVDGLPAMLSLIRKNFLNFMHWAISNQITMVLYTRGTARYAERIYKGLQTVYRHRYCNHDASVEVFDAVIATNKKMKTLRLVNDVMSLRQFNRVFVLDDDESVESSSLHHVIPSSFSVFCELSQLFPFGWRSNIRIGLVASTRSL